MGMYCTYIHTHTSPFLFFPNVHPLRGLTCYTVLYIYSAFDGKIKIWSVETRTCVATHTETNNKPLWSVKWLPKIGRSEAFAVAGAGRAISFYREATGG